MRISADVSVTGIINLGMMKNTTISTGEVLARKNSLGRRASYRELRERTGVSHTTINRVLEGHPLPFVVDEQAILQKVSQALDDIEREAEQAEAA